MQSEKATTRTRWAEQSIAAFLSMPLISEFVFSSPQTIDGTQREVADFLVSYGDPGLLISLKSQEDPGSRTPERDAAWVRKTAKEAVRQLHGALRTGNARPMWCDHARRGRVEFPDGLPRIAHGIVLVETLQPVVLDGSSDDLPLQYQGTPVSYFSVNDFLNVTLQLRTLPEILEYLDRRRALPLVDLRTVGEENGLFGFYLLNGGTFEGCLSIADARIMVAAQNERLNEVLRRKSEADSYSTLMEHVAHELATRLPNHLDSLPPELAAMFDSDGQRANYLEMQRVLATLRLPERVELGRAFESTARQLAHEQEGFIYRAAFFDSQPGRVYVVGSSKTIDRPRVLSRLSALALGAMAHYGKGECFAVINRDCAGYEVEFARGKTEPTLAAHAIGDTLFGKLRVETRALQLVPNEK